MTWQAKSWPLSVVVLAGGNSAEREVSLASGQQVARALGSVGHQVRIVDPHETPLPVIDFSGCDVCFLALHGGAGEDGRIQQQLEKQGVVYTGSGPAASRLAMSKSAAKERFVQARVPTLPYVLFHITEPLDDVAANVARLGWPVVIKPDSQGSSLGVGFASNRAALDERIATSCGYDPFSLAEPWIDGREFTVAVLGREPLPLLEVLTPRGLLDYEAKYHDPATRCRCDTGLPADEVVRLQSIAVSAAAALDTRGLVRVDLMLDLSGRPWVLEVNTTPGMTATSFAPRAAEQAGLDLPALCEWILRDALSLEVAR